MVADLVPGTGGGADQVGVGGDVLADGVEPSSDPTRRTGRSSD
jgi:hypothetical protein